MEYEKWNMVHHGYSTSHKRWMCSNRRDISLLPGLNAI